MEANKWEDTVMSNDKARNISIDVLGLDKIADIGNATPDLAFDIGQIQKLTAQDQAKITWPIAFKAGEDKGKQEGFDKVVEWIEEHRWRHMQYGNSVFVYAEEWQAFLKERLGK